MHAIMAGQGVSYSNSVQDIGMPTRFNICIDQSSHEVSAIITSFYCSVKLARGQR